ncbi:hypothetical protein [uncultured Maribacter sp.]|uniref:hypothetical protein n=1 Tax=uncultured Maribacter sp. TaxID=431308 RepID=UPI00262BD1F8|nr:hypothetical protein [uncultured Maribacter sp.]
MKTEVIIGVLVVLGVMYFVSRNKSGNNSIIHVAKQIQFSELESVMTQLLDGKLEYEFFGITSDGIDCIYFANDNGEINIEFEVITNEQKPYAEKLSSFAKINNYNLTKTSYGNKPTYSDLKEAPVYKLELNVDKHKATEIGIEIMRTIFNKNGMTKFDVVP